MDLKQQGPESNMVNGEFSRTLPRAQVIKCNRVENSSLQAKWMEMRQKVRAEALAQPPVPATIRLRAEQQRCADGEVGGQTGKEWAENMERWLFYYSEDDENLENLANAKNPGHLFRRRCKSRQCPT
jgi:hypothetical protein